MDPEFNGLGIVDWASIGIDFRMCLESLEYLEGDGKGLKKVEDTRSFAGVGLLLAGEDAAYDISEKSYPWKIGYFQALMGVAKAVEQLDDMVIDKTRNLVFPKDVMIGPSNPNARPVPPNMATAPLEENCGNPSAPPELFYLRILNTKGLSTAQMLDAALAYGNWLEYKKDNEAADEIYEFAVDIVAHASPGAHLAIDRESGVIKEAGNTQATPNMLRASTALAGHRARVGEVADALPIYLSVLRARRSAPMDPSSLSHPASTSTADHNDRNGLLDFIKTYIRFRPFPAEGLTGDEPLTRPAQADCAEAELMLYIGEILFATTKSKPEDGLAWTRNAVELAQQGLTSAKPLSAETTQQCKACLQLGVDNWSKMVAKLAREEKAINEREGNAAQGWKGWFGSNKGTDPKSSRWQGEALAVEAFRQEVIKQGIMDQMAATARAPNSVWIG